METTLRNISLLSLNHFLKPHSNEIDISIAIDRAQGLHFRFRKKSFFFMTHVAVGVG